MGIFYPSLPNAGPQQPAVSVVGAVVAHAALLGLLFATGATDRIAEMVKPIAVRLIELAPEAPPPAPVPPRQPPPPRKVAPPRAIEPLPVLTAAAPAPAIEFAVPPAPTFSPPAPAAIAAPAPAPVAAPIEPVLTPARFDAAYLANPKPAYPPASRRLGEEGRVVLRVHVSPGGAAETIEIKQPSGFARLDNAAREAVSRWRFAPARRGEQAIAAWVLVPIVFNLES
ncbi:MAG: TonB family protein [Gammaproteobacteria bacterium]|nr:TonB family protein [Gammaproteobacteria bacterium]MBU1646439.1 TonB family protein [Gammaproteobacteria bacterium]MBU1970982.1 TonB family protein [Gammaproteobacteria bacterium]